MHKILDWLNQRAFDVNTVKGAQAAVESLLANDPQRLQHTAGVVRHMEQWLEQTNATEEECSILLQIAYLHDIGYSEKFKFADFHPFDGFTYLKENEWDKRLIRVILHHSYARELAELTHPELILVYKSYPIRSEEEQRWLDIITLIDLHTSGKGELVSFEDRKEDVAMRYGDHPVTRHLEQITPQFHALMERYEFRGDFK